MALKMMKELEYSFYEESLRELEMFSPGKRSLRRVLTVINALSGHRSTEGKVQREWRQFLLTGVQGQDKRLWAQTETQVFSEYQEEETLLAVRLTRHWHRLPREVEECPSVEI